MKLASFDIFDTALIRRCGKPENIFYLMAERLYPGDEGKQREFVEWRKKQPGVIVSHRKYVSHGTHGIHGEADASPALSKTTMEVMLEDVYGLDNAQCTINIF
ncbi:MAG: hypothetical protein IKY67_10795 [Paludibacteraceae bacterium]|nr:hypothetical protein [Paludibacteraceae bacterium]